MISSVVKMVFKHISKSWKHHATLQFATLLVLIACFTVVAGVLTFSNNMYKVLTLWGESLQMSVYLSDQATDDNKSAIEKFLGENDKVDKLQFVTQEKALVQFRDQMASYAPDLLNDKDLLKFIPQSFQFSIHQKVVPNEQLNVMKDLATQLETQAGVEEVSYGQDWVKSYSKIFNALTWVGSFFVLIIFASAAFIMSNSIHSSIQQRRTEIEVLELIGATTGYIRTPYLWEGALMGGFSCLLALSLSYGLFVSLKNYGAEQLSMLQLSHHIEFLSLSICFSLVAVAMILGAVASYICVRRINDGWAAAQSSARAF